MRGAATWLTLAAIVFTAEISNGAPEQTAIVIGAGPVGGFSFPLGGALCSLYEHGAVGPPEPIRRRCYVATDRSSTDTLDRLRYGDLNFAIVQSDVAANAGTAHGGFATRPPFVDLRSVVGFYGEALTVLVRSDGPIKQIDDLRGKRVAVGEPGAPDPLFGELLDALGWSKAELERVVEIPRADQISALCSSRVEAIVVTAPSPNGFVRQVLNTCPTTILDLAGAGIDSIISGHPGDGETRIDLAAYGRPGRVVRSFGPRTILVTTTKTDAKLILDLLAALFSHIDLLQQAHPGFAALNAASISASGGLAIERHPIATKYLAAIGINPTDTGE
jgi:TRAP transporter TAXI family solute receptor